MSVLRCPCSVLDMVWELQPAERLTLQPFPTEDDRMNGWNIRTDGVIRGHSPCDMSKTSSIVILNLELHLRLMLVTERCDTSIRLESVLRCERS